ncbi:MAG: transpeptidase-transglycosylase, partial [Deltaproteobacteria bacterium]
AAALARRNRVLAAMVEDGALDEGAGQRARGEPLRLAPPHARPVGALYVADEVARELGRLLPPDAARAPGLAVFTAVDADAQREAERAVRRRLESSDRARVRRRRDAAPLQAALVALDPATGRILALVGGRDYGSSPLDRAVRARRQPGSAFKPFVYLAALDPARHVDRSARTVVSPLEDSPLEVAAGARVWRPANYDGVFHGSLPLEDALAQSLNAATARLALDVGLEAVAGAATDLGIPGPFPIVPSLALGVAETSLLDLTAAYGVFASGGVRRAPDLVVAITSSAGETLYAARAEETRVLDPGVAYVVTHLLERVVDAGTARAARRAGIDGTAAGKTGTTDDTRDAWFIGFTPEVIAGVWVGFDDGAPTGFTGAEAALPIWIDFVRATAGPGAARPFEVPDDIVWRDVDPSSGLLATSGCPEVRREPFLAGTEPQRLCDRHRAAWAAVGEGVGDVLRGGGRAIGAGGRRVFGWVGRLFR